MWQQLVAQDLPPPSASYCRTVLGAEVLRWQFLHPPARVRGKEHPLSPPLQETRDLTLRVVGTPLEWQSGAESHLLG